MTDSPQQVKQMARSLLQAGNLQAATDLLSRACSPDQQDIELWLTYANCLNASGDTARLENVCTSLLALQPTNTDFIFNYGCILTANNKLGEALTQFQKVVASTPGHSVAHDNIGQIYEEHGRIDEALSSYLMATDGDRPLPVHHRHAGVMYLKKKDPANAEKHFLLAMAQDDSQAKAHVELGRAQSELGKMDEARASFERALELNPELNYARFWLSALDDSRDTDAAKHRFVSRLFDGHAEDFDKILVDDLGYRIPWMIAEELADILDDGARLNMLDLGCGTGLCAETLKPFTASITGIDISPNMVEKAKRRGHYDELHVGDSVDVMAGLDSSYDAIIAADVFVYVGGLSEVFEACRDALVSGGKFIFTVEKSDHDEDYMIRATGRYAHSENYIKELAEANGFVQKLKQDVTLRMDAGNAIRGMLYILERR